MEDFFKHQAEWLNVWQEQQQKLSEQYAQWGEEFSKGAVGAASQQIPANFESLLKNQQDLLQQFNTFSAEMQQNIQQLWGDKLPDELLRLYNFNILQQFYKSWLGNMKFPGGLQNPFMGGQNWTDPSSFLKSFMDMENPFFSVFSSRNPMDDFQQMLNLLQGVNSSGGGLYSQLFSTYQGFFNQLANTGTSQGFDKLIETFSSWKEQTDRYLLAPQVGVNRETAQDFTKAISLSLDYIRAFASMGKMMEESARKSGNRFQAKLVERSLNNEPPIKFSDFCSLWTKENEAVFLEVFSSDVFAKTQREFTSSGLRLKLQINKLVEKFLDQTPIALKRDVDLASKEILQLKRDLRQSRKQLQPLVTEVKAAQEAIAASEKRVQGLETSLDKAQSESQSKIQALEDSTTKVQSEAQAKINALEASLAKAQNESLATIKALEGSLAKVQKLVETAEQTAKSAAAQQSKPAATAGKVTTAATKKATIATTKKAGTSAIKKASPATAQKTTTAKSAPSTRKTKKSTDTPAK